ncbi:hypothetical protein Trydic_g22961 [Trypoxylus dichotomus]
MIENNCKIEIEDHCGHRRQGKEEREEQQQVGYRNSSCSSSGSTSNNYDEESLIRQLVRNNVSTARIVRLDITWSSVKDDGSTGF